MKNKCKFLLNLLVIALFSLVLAACGGSSDSLSDTTDTDNSSEPKGDTQEAEMMDPITISFADFFPATHEAGIQVTQGWADAVEEVTDGLVKVEVYPGGSLLDSSDIYEGVISGVADVGHSAVGYNLGRFPLLGAMYLGGVSYKNSKVSSYVARDIVEEFAPEELKDTKVMFVYGLGPGDIISNNRVEKMEDLKGMEIRASGNQVKTFELLGATPIDIAMPDAYEALSRGVVDGAVVPLEVLEGWKLAEVTKYVTKVPFVYNAVHYVTMNREVWDSLPEDIQAKIEDLNTKMFEETAVSLFDAINDSALSYTTENFEHEIIELSDDEQARWLKELEPIKEEYIKELDAQGIPGKEVIDRIEELAEKYNNEF